jgi:hypothetical protein
MHKGSNTNKSSTSPEGGDYVDSITIGPSFRVAAGDWFGSQDMGPHSPHEAPHVCTV